MMRLLPTRLVSNLPAAMRLTADVRACVYCSLQLDRDF